MHRTTSPAANQQLAVSGPVLYATLLDSHVEVHRHHKQHLMEDDDQESRNDDGHHHDRWGEERRNAQKTKASYANTRWGGINMNISISYLPKAYVRVHHMADIYVRGSSAK